MKSNILYFFLCLILGCNSRIYIVRHAEKLNNTDTSSLSTSGQVRANVLRDTLKDKHIQGIFATRFNRTQLTARPLAGLLKCGTIIYSNDSLINFANSLLRLKGKNVLVIGHSTTIPQLIEYITGDTVIIPETKFDKLYIITLRGRNKRQLETREYGSK